MRSILSTRRRKVLATFAACAVAGLAGLAIAAWLTSGEGPGSARVGQLQAPTVTAGTAVGALLPGETGAAAFRIANGNPIPLKVIAVDLAAADGGSGVPGCSFMHLNVVPATGLDVPVPTGTNDVVVPGAFRLSADAPTECQGATLERRAKLLFSTTP
jgi:hypothetical protein